MPAMPSHCFSAVFMVSPFSRSPGDYSLTRQPLLSVISNASGRKRMTPLARAVVLRRHEADVASTRVRSAARRVAMIARRARLRETGWYDRAGRRPGRRLQKPLEDD